MSATTELNRIGSLSQMADRVNTLFSEEISGLNTAQIDFFNALEDAANNPHNTAPAERVIAAGNTMTSRFNFLDSQLDSMQKEINSNFKETITEINNLTKRIFNINQEISAKASTNASGPPNDLLDQRDLLLQQLSQHVSINKLSRDNFGIDVAMENGLPLVTLAGATELSTVINTDDPEKLSLALQTGSIMRPIADPPGGGILGGLMEFNNEMLDPVRNEIGRMAAVLSSNVNAVYEQIDPANTGTPQFFSTGAITPLANSTNQGTATLSVNLVDSQAITASNYQMTFDGTEYTLTRLSDNTQISGTGNLLMDGLKFTATGAAVAGDSFLIKPVAKAAAAISMMPIDPLSLGTTLGTATELSIPVAQTIADLRQQRIFENGSATLTEQYATIVTQVGSATRTAEIQLQSMQSIVEETQVRHDEVSAVSLDEEAANLIKYQQAYEASARVIAVAGTLFDTLMGTLNRI